MERKFLDNQAQTYREVTLGKTVYHVTSVFLGEKDLGKTLENLAVRKAMTEIKTDKK